MHAQKSHTKVRYIKHINVPVDKACMGDFEGVHIVQISSNDTSGMFIWQTWAG